MATSGSINFTQTRNEIITDALYMINALADDEIAAESDILLGSRELNRMVKAWEGQGIHLWTQETGILFPQKDQKTYEIYSGGDNSTDSDAYIQTYTTEASISGANSLTVNSSTGMTGGDYIGIQLDDNSLQWSKIDTVVSTTSVRITGTFDDAVNSGAFIYTYTTKLNQPLKIHSANRVQVSTNRDNNIDIHMNYLSYEEYFSLTNQEQTGIPISWNFVKERDKSILRLWYIPDNVNYLIRFTYTRKIEDFDNSNDNPDLPQEWLDAITINLAYRLLKYFGKNQGDVYASIKAEAESSLQLMLDYDTEKGSVYLRPSIEGGF